MISISSVTGTTRRREDLESPVVQTPLFEPMGIFIPRWGPLTIETTPKGQTDNFCGTFRKYHDINSVGKQACSIV